MDISIYNSNLVKVDMLSEKFSLVRKLFYNRPDSFILTASLNDYTIKALQEDCVLRLNNRKELMYITNVERNSELGKHQIIAKGYGLEHYLERRIINDYYYKKDTVISHIINILNDNALNPSDTKRIIPYFTVRIDSSVGKTSIIPYQVEEDTDLLSVITELCNIEDLGYKVEMSEDYTSAVLIIYRGSIKTSNQDANLPVIFSPENENMLEQRLISDKSKFKNVLLVIGQGEEDDKFKVTVGDTDKSGLDRYEGIINAKDLDPDNDGEWLSPEEYKELLEVRGKVKISDFKPMLVYESKIHTNSNLSYIKDFNLGDVVEIRNKKWNIRETPRIIGIEEVYEDSFQVYVTFGDMLPTPSEKFNQIEKEMQKDKSNQGKAGETVDLSPIKKDIQDLQLNKAEQSEIERLERVIFDLDVSKANINYVDDEIKRLEDIINSLEIPEEVDLTPIYKEIEQLKLLKADKITLEKEIERLERMIREIIEGEDSEYIIPRTTNNPVDQEIFYKQNTKKPPFVNWIEDDWGVWTKVSDKHLKTSRTGTYSAISGRVLNEEGTVKIDIKKKDQNHRHMLRQVRKGRNIFEVRETKKDKTYVLHVKPGDTLTITSLFDGDVYLDYIGIEDDVRLSVYKNGVIEEVANKRKVEERLEDYTLKEELISKTGELDDLETKEKGNLVDAINEVNNKESSIIDSNTGDRYDIIAIDGKFYFERK